MNFIFFILPCIVYAAYTPCGSPPVCQCSGERMMCSNLETLPHFSRHLYRGITELDITGLGIGTVLLKDFRNLKSVMLKDCGVLFCEIDEIVAIMLINSHCQNIMLHTTKSYQIIEHTTGYETNQTVIIGERHMSHHDIIKIFLAILICCLGMLIFMLICAVVIMKWFRRRQHAEFEPVEMIVINQNYGRLF